MYKYVFEEAQKELRRVFGMQMTELPMREKVTVSQRRAAQRTDRATTSSKVYALTSTLSDNYRVNEDIIVPPKVPTSESEATYVGLYTFVVSIISLCGGRITEEKLNRYLRRANAEPYTPVDKTDKLLQRFCKEGYLVKIKDSSNGEEQIEYTVGPRGKVEVGTDGVAGLVKTVYGDGTTEDLEARIQRSLGLDERPARRQQPNPPGEINTSSGRAINASTRTPGRPATRQTRSRRQAEEEAEEEEE
ncbi:MAG: hypothetical protein M1815_005083 [Lichina confinis]|nr:MAG: hypothetical protein M1815_005083 [Lichina confinis]